MRPTTAPLTGRARMRAPAATPMTAVQPARADATAVAPDVTAVLFGSIVGAGLLSALVPRPSPARPTSGTPRIAGALIGAAPGLTSAAVVAAAGAAVASAPLVVNAASVRTASVTRRAWPRFGGRLVAAVAVFISPPGVVEKCVSVMVC